MICTALKIHSVSIINNNISCSVLGTGDQFQRIQIYDIILINMYSGSWFIQL